MQVRWWETTPARFETRAAGGNVQEAAFENMLDHGKKKQKPLDWIVMWSSFFAAKYVADDLRLVCQKRTVNFDIKSRAVDVERRNDRCVMCEWVARVGDVVLVVEDFC